MKCSHFHYFVLFKKIRLLFFMEFPNTRTTYELRDQVKRAKAVGEKNVQKSNFKMLGKCSLVLEEQTVVREK